MFELGSVNLIDSSGYACYRAGATLSWWKRSKPDDTRSTAELLESEDFTIPLERQYKQGLSKLKGPLIFARDCWIEKIWRLKFFPKYKSGRSDCGNSHRPMGPIVKWLHKMVARENLGKVVRVEEAEADDIIAVYVRYLTDVYPTKNIVIVTLDSDLKQLVAWGDHVSIYNPKSKKFFCDQKEAAQVLETKIVKGDATDKVPALSTVRDVDDPHYARIHNSILVDLSYIPRYIRDQAISQLSLGRQLLKPEIYQPKELQLGLCCMHTFLRKKNIFCSRTLRLVTIEQKGIDCLLEKSLQNCNDLLTMIEWCVKTKTKGAGNAVPVRVMRISSDMLPHISNPKLATDVYDKVMATVDPVLKKAGLLVRKYGIRITFHPGQFNVVGTPHEDKFENTISELKWHAEFLDRMGCDNDSVMVVHGGGMYGNKPETMKRWVVNFSRLPKSVQRRLVLENCEKCFNIKDCLWVSENTKKNGIQIPVVFDTHHYDCYEQMHPDETFHEDGASHYIPAILETWKNRNIKPKFHVSEQCCGKQVGAHSDYIENIPLYLLEIPSKYNTQIDIMIEAKLKEQAIRKLYTKYGAIFDPEVFPGKKSKAVLKKPKAKKKAVFKKSIHPQSSMPLDTSSDCL